LRGKRGEGVRELVLSIGGIGVEELVLKYQELGLRGCISNSPC
jgi:hypothetical protein